MVKRSEELSGKAGVDKRCIELFEQVDKAFEDQKKRSDEIKGYWELYNSVLGPKQVYNGNSKIFVPIVNSAVNARKTRFVNQLFPQSGRYVEVISEDPNGDIPHATTSLLEYYVRKAKLKTQVLPALVVAGDIEGQYTVYVDWETTERKVVNRTMKPLQIDGEELPGEDIEDLEEDDVKEGCPTVEVLSDQDFVVYPATADSVEQAIAQGGYVAVKRRWSKDMIRQKIKSKDIPKALGESFLEAMSKVSQQGDADVAKKLAKASGILGDVRGKHAEIYEVWTNLKIDGDRLLCRAYLGGPKKVLGAKRCPYWCDKPPVISAPVEKVPNLFKGRAPVADVAEMQIFANDAINEAADTAHYAAMPIILTDPEKNPNVGSMILGLAAIWQTDPRSTQFAQFPELWRHGFDIVSACKQEIFQTLSVNPAMMPQSTGGTHKRNQAEIAAEMQADILTAIDAVGVLEEGIMTPLIERFAAYDQQFRNDEIVIRSFGEIGMQAKMQRMQPIQLDKRYEFRWFGVEATRNAQQLQQQISLLNMMQQIPPQAYPGYQLNIAPVLVQAVENVFGPRLGGMVFKSIREQLTVDPVDENMLLIEGIPVETHAQDNDPQHLQEHMAILQSGDPTGVIRAHIQEHQHQMKLKEQAQAQAMMQQQGGPPGGGTPGGAQVVGPHAPKGPPGAINADQMARAGAPGMPRKM